MKRKTTGWLNRARSQDYAFGIAPNKSTLASQNLEGNKQQSNQSSLSRNQHGLFGFWWKAFYVTYILTQRGIGVHSYTALCLIVLFW
jgi:hypothetical protein